MITIEGMCIYSLSHNNNNNLKVLYQAVHWALSSVNKNIDKFKITYKSNMKNNGIALY